jgi:hypothetical protein
MGNPARTLAVNLRVRTAALRDWLRGADSALGGNPLLGGPLTLGVSGPWFRSSTAGGAASEPRRTSLGPRR